MRPENEMKIKSYYSRTVEDAMAAARQEMGPDAMLVNSRKAPPEVRHLGEYEVVFANVAGARGAVGEPARGGQVCARGGAGRSCCWPTWRARWRRRRQH